MCTSHCSRRTGLLRFFGIRQFSNARVAFCVSEQQNRTFLAARHAATPAEAGAPAVPAAPAAPAAADAAANSCDHFRHHTKKNPPLPQHTLQKRGNSWRTTRVRRRSLPGKFADSLSGLQFLGKVFGEILNYNGVTSVGTSGFRLEDFDATQHDPSQYHNAVQNDAQH